MQEHDQDRHPPFDNEVAQPFHLGDKGAVAEAFDRFVEQHDQCRQHRHGAKHAEQHALRHNHTDIGAQRQAHGAHRQEAGDGGQRAAGDGGEGLLNGGCHCLLVIRLVSFFFLIPVQQEDGEVGGHCQLQHRRQRFGDKGDLSEEVVGAHVVQHRHADTGR